MLIIVGMYSLKTPSKFVLDILYSFTCLFQCIVGVTTRNGLKAPFVSVCNNLGRWPSIIAKHEI